VFSQVQTRLSSLNRLPEQLKHFNKNGIMKLKKSMYRPAMVLVSLFLVLLYSCGDSIVPEFTINDNYGLMYGTEDDIDASDLVTVTSGEDVRLRYCADTSDASKYVWRAGAVEIGTGPSVTYRPSFDADTILKIVLCVNDEQHCRCRYLKVKGLPSFPVDTVGSTDTLRSPVKPHKPGGGGGRKSDPPPPTPSPSPSPKEAILDKKAVIGLPAEMASRVMTCGDAGSDRITAKLTVNNNLVELSSVVVFVSGCGKLSLSITGGGTDLSETFTLNSGRNLLLLSDLGARLDAGTYELRLVTATGGGCTDSSAPKFVNASNCDNSYEKTSPELTMDQKGNKYIHELKISYR
jgi:hypothetical protein